MTDGSENITLPLTSFTVGKYSLKPCSKVLPVRVKFLYLQSIICIIYFKDLQEKPLKLFEAL